ncbi:MAG: hypothetical protein IT565_08645 [Rhodospirillales bacterium]|nr:hypothetical protein [Rhodospirillales bacterium]
MPETFPPLPDIPRYRVSSTAQLARAGRPAALAILAEARRVYTTPALRLGDRLSRQWLERSRNPYRGEIAEIAGILGRPGGWLLNLSYEWACTSAVEGPRLARTLDWKLDGLGRHVALAGFVGPAGPYESVTWPGFVGVTTALAQGRFAGALNQAPMPRTRLPLPLDWLRLRLRVWRGDALPPSHLLRRVFDQAADYQQAKAMLAEIPVCLPVFYSLAGTKPGQSCIIERTPRGAFLHEGRAAIANHWLTPGLTGAPRGYDSPGRLALMEGQWDGLGWDFDWVKPPILNPDTRLSVLADAASGQLLVQGWEGQRPATAIHRGDAIGR